MTERAWTRIGEADRCSETQDFLLEEVPCQDRNAVAEMQKCGLNVSAVGAAEAAELRAVAAPLTATWRGSRVPANIYDAVVAARTEFRANCQSSAWGWGR